MNVQEWLEHVPAVSIYALVAVVVGLESLGIPLPGEIVLVAAALLSSRQGTVDPVVLGACAVVGAVVGDSTGYAIGRKGGRPLLERLGRRFPKHFGPSHVATAEHSFNKWGMWAVFFGRFVALLRIFAGPLAGVLRMPYWKFFTANFLGGVAWAGGTTAVVYYIGVVAEDWLKRFSWFGLVLAVLVGAGSLLLVRHRAAKHAKTAPQPQADGTDGTADVEDAADTGGAADAEGGQGAGGAGHAVGGGAARGGEQVRTGGSERVPGRD